MTPSHSSQERRRHPRIEGSIPLKISSDAGDVVTETWNLSRSGVYCRVDKYLDPMTKLRIHLLLPLKKSKKTVTKKIFCQGVVVRTEAVSGTGFYNTAIFFNELHQKDADSISDFITERVEHHESQNKKDS